MSDASPIEAHIALDLADVRRTLRELWSSEMLRDAPVVRAETHNLIIGGIEGAKVDANEHIIDLAMTHPGRIIIVESRPSESNLTGTASVYCRGEGGKQICGELITLQARGSARGDAHSTIASLLLPDLPVYIWWQGSLPEDDHLFDEMSNLATRVYFDSSSFSDPTADMSTMSGLKDFQVGDLNWFRLTAWRQMMAQLYDVPAAREAMQALRSIDVHFVANAEPYNPNRALLLVAWLAERLGWQLAEAKVGKTGGYTFQFENRSGGLKAEIVEGHASNLPRGELTGVFIVSGKDAPYAMPRVVIGEHHDCLEMRVEESLEARDSDPIHIVSYEPRRDTALLAEALLEGRDPDFRAVLTRAGELLGAVD